MSRRVDVFRHLFGSPSVETNFWVFIPFIETSVVMVEDCTLPFPVYKEVSGSYKGNAAYYPGAISVPGAWSCTMTENRVGLHLLEAYSKLVSEQNLSGTIFKKSYILIALTVSNTEIPIPHALFKLDGVWLQSIQPINLNMANPGNPTKLRFTFRYDSVKNVTLSAINRDVFNSGNLLV